jgi:hypothetical protein
VLLLLVPLALGRAIHPNALYPSLLEEARRAERPLGLLASTLAGNVARNLALVREADPLRNPEDAVLVFLVALAVAAAAAIPLLPRPARRFALAALGSAAALTAALFVLYVVRARGGVWGGVRAWLPWAPVLLVLAMPLLFRPRSRLLVAALLLLTAGAFAWLDLRQIRFFNHYKDTDLEDQLRMERYISRYVDAYRPQRIVARTFLYGLTHYPVEVVWSPPQDARELQALEQAVSFEFVVIYERDPLRLALLENPRYLRVNKDDRGAQFLIWRRLY